MNIIIMKIQMSFSRVFEQIEDVTDNEGTYSIRKILNQDIAESWRINDRRKQRDSAM